MKSEVKPILLVADNNYMKALIAQINSIYNNFKEEEVKIYLVHALSDENLAYLSNFIYSNEKLNLDDWKNVRPGKNSHVKTTNMGKFQVEIVEEPNFMYLDTDIIVNKPFKFEHPKTMTCDGGLEDLIPDKPYFESMELMIDFIRKNKGYIEKGDKFMLFCDGAYFGNKEWVSNILKPKIKYCSKNMPQAEKHWTGMGFFQATIGLLQRPIELFKIKELIPFFETTSILSKYDIIHYIGPEKPWNYKKGDFPFCAGDMWWHYYENGPIKPVKEN